MARRAARTQPINTTLPKGRKSTQRERIINGMIAAANRDGYAGANVTAVITQAGVSRPTFYDYFADRDDCFLGAITDSHERLAGRLHEAIAGQPAEMAIGLGDRRDRRIRKRGARPRALPDGRVDGRWPTRARRARSGHRRARGMIETRTGRRSEKADPGRSPRVAIGGIYRLLAPRLRRGEPNLGGVAEELEAGLRRTSSRASALRWRALEPSPPRATSPVLADESREAPKRLPPGRPGLSNEEVAANHRERILYAAAELAASKGYGATTVADITKGPGSTAATSTRCSSTSRTRS